MLEKIILSKDEAKNLQLIEDYNNLIYDTECVLYEYLNGKNFRDFIKYGYDYDSVKFSNPNLSSDDIKKVCHILQIFEGRIFDLCKQIKLQVFKGVMNDYALELIREWEKFPNTFPLSN